MNDQSEILASDAQPHVDLLLQEFKVAGALPTGWNDVALNQESRRNLWAGQSADGRKWDAHMPNGEPAKPWDGASDTRVPLVDSVCNGDVAVNSAAFHKGELRAEAVDPAQAELAASASTYLHWWVKTKFAQEWWQEQELSTQYSREHGWAVAYVGWERELGRRKQKVTLQELGMFVQQLSAASDPAAVQATQENTSPPSPLPTASGAERGDVGGDPSTLGDPAEAGSVAGDPASLLAMLMDPSQSDAAAEVLRDVYREYVTQLLEGKGFFAEELGSEAVLDLPVKTARRCVKELRETGETWLPVTYVVKNQPLVQALMPYLEFLAATGTTELQRARVLFWRRYLTEWELESKKAEGWDAEWIDEVKKTKGSLSSWAAAVGDGTNLGIGIRRIGNTQYIQVSQEQNPLIEVVHAFVKKADEDGVTGVWETIFSPHVTKLPGETANKLNLGELDFNTVKAKPGDTFCAKHTLLEYAHGRYPFVSYKRENIGRALVDTRSVPEIAHTWQTEAKGQRDMLFNRAQWDTLPPVRTTMLGGSGYRLGPGAEVPMKRNDVIEALDLKAPPPQLSLELVELLQLQADDYFGQPNAKLPPDRIAVRQQKAVQDFYFYWGGVWLQAFSLQLQYNAAEIARVTGDEQLAAMNPFDVMEQLRFGMHFDVQELNQDYLQKKMAAVFEQVLPADAGGVVDRTALTNIQLRMIDPSLARLVMQDKTTAAQKIYDDVDLQVGRMALGNEAKYTENDPTAPTKLQYVQTIVESNPKYQGWLQNDPRFQELMKNYVKNLQMSVAQQQNKTVGRIGVKPVNNQ